MIRALIFDCFGVLYHGSSAHLRELTPPDELPRLADIRMAFDRGYLVYDEYLDGVADITGTPAPEIKRIIEADHVRNDELVEYLKSFKKEYKIGLLSNVGIRVIDQLFTANEQSELFDAMVLSSEVGMVKPYPEIFTYTAAKLELAPEECLMIDDLIENINGANRAGMDGVVYHTIAQLREDLQRKGIRGA